jgi:hypothetical protein
MSLLDDLKNQAEVLRKRQQSGSSIQDHHFREIHERLKVIHKHLNELVDSLNTLQPEVIRYFYVEPSKVLEDLRQSGYTLSVRRKTIDHADYFEEVVVRTRCVGTRKLSFDKEDDAPVSRMREFLWSNSLKFDLRESRSERGYTRGGSFTIEPDVPVSISIAGVPERGHVVIVIRNLEKLGEVSYTYEIDEVDIPLIEELARLLIGKPNQFRTIGRHQQPVRTSAYVPPPRSEPVARPTTPDTPPGNEAPRSLLGSLKSLLQRKTD